MGNLFGSDFDDWITTTLPYMLHYPIIGVSLEGGTKSFREES